VREREREWEREGGWGRRKRPFSINKILIWLKN